MSVYVMETVTIATVHVMGTAKMMISYLTTSYLLRGYPVTILVLQH
ncbi:hypothetical protein KO361_05310 [Candidatus Woesearchaeota archaeon]|nr:hypothetical protein [Candidatus Woesearchaeota archaeon]